ncbi:hypothetical protein AAC387_Pa01g4067 [Persea americana]
MLSPPLTPVFVWKQNVNVFFKLLFEASRSNDRSFFQDLAASIDEEDVAKFTDAVKEIDSMTRLDTWKTTLLLRAKSALKAKEVEEDDLT